MGSLPQPYTFARPPWIEPPTHVQRRLEAGRRDLDRLDRAIARHQASIAAANAVLAAAAAIYGGLATSERAAVLAELEAYYDPAVIGDVDTLAEVRMRLTAEAEGECCDE